MKILQQKILGSLLLEDFYFFSKAFAWAVSWSLKLKSFNLESLKLESFAEVGKSQTKLERTKRSWEEPSEVGKNRAKLKRTDRTWQVSFEVGKFRWSWKVSLQSESLNELGKLSLKLESDDSDDLNSKTKFDD